MNRILGFLVGIVWFGLAAGAYLRAQGGWAEGHADVGFWWTVIAAFLAIAALGALVGTWLHTRADVS